MEEEKGCRIQGVGGRENNGILERWKNGMMGKDITGYGLTPYD